jgi:hypothetical protein
MPSLLIHPDRLDRHFRWSAPLLFIGIAGAILCRFAPQPYGLMTSWFLMMMGALGGAFRAWRSERGLWMLAILFMLIVVPTWLMFMASHFVPSMRGTVPNPWPLDLDAAGVTLLAGQMSRILVSVAVHNARLSRRPIAGSAADIRG